MDNNNNNNNQPGNIANNVNIGGPGGALPVIPPPIAGPDGQLMPIPVHVQGINALTSLEINENPYKFTEKTDVERWAALLKWGFEVNGVAAGKRLANVMVLLPHHIREQVEEWINAAPARNTFEAVLNYLRTRYARTIKDKQNAFTLLIKTRQEDFEGLEEFYARFLEVLRKCNALPDEVQAQSFLNAIKSNLRGHLYHRGKEYLNLPEVYQDALSVDKQIKNGEIPAQPLIATNIMSKLEELTSTVHKLTQQPSSNINNPSRDTDIISTNKTSSTDTDVDMIPVNKITSLIQSAFANASKNKSNYQGPGRFNNRKRGNTSNYNTGNQNKFRNNNRNDNNDDNNSYDNKSNEYVPNYSLDNPRFDKFGNTCSHCGGPHKIDYCGRHKSEIQAQLKQAQDQLKQLKAKVPGQK